MGDAMQNFFATKREQKKKKKKRFLLMQQKSKSETETQKQRPKNAVDISETPAKPATQIPGIVPIESMATNNNQRTPLVRKNPGELNPVPKVPISKPTKPRVIASPLVPKSIDSKKDVFKNTNTSASHGAVMSWSSTGGSQVSPATTGRTRNAFPSQQERDLERQTRGRQFYDRHNNRTSRSGYRGGNAGSHSSVRPHLGPNQQKAKTKFDVNKFRRRDRRMSGNDRSVVRGPVFSQRARLTDTSVSRRAESGSIYKGNQLSAMPRRGDDGANRKQTAASVSLPPSSVSTSTESITTTASITSTSRDASVEDTHAVVGAKPKDSSAPALQSTEKVEAESDAEKNSSERISTGQTHRGSMLAKTGGKALPLSDVVATPHSSWSQTVTFRPHVLRMSATLAHSLEDKDAYVQLLLWSLEGSELLQGMTFKQQQEFLTQWVSCHQHRARLIKFSPRGDNTSLLSVVAGAVACPCRLLLPRHDVIPEDESGAKPHTLGATLISGCAFAPEMLMRAGMKQHDAQHCRTLLFDRLLNDALAHGSEVLITFLRTDQSLQLHRECGFAVCGNVHATTISLHAISTALLRNADQAHQSDVAAVARAVAGAEPTSAQLFVRPAVAADIPAIENVRVVYTTSYSTIMHIELPKDAWTFEVHRGINGTAIHEMPLPGKAAVPMSRTIYRYVVCCRNEAAVKGYLCFYRERRDIHIVDMAAISMQAWRVVAHFLQSQACASVERVTWVGSADHPLQALLSLGEADRHRTGGASLHTSDKSSFGVDALHVSNGSNPWATSGNPWSRGHEDGDELWNPRMEGGQRDSVPTIRRYCALRVVNVMRAFSQFRFPALIPDLMLVVCVVGDCLLSHNNQTLRIAVSDGRAQVETAPPVSQRSAGEEVFEAHLVVHVRGICLLLYGGGMAGAGAVPISHILARGLMTLTAGSPQANQRVLAQLNYLFR